MILDLPVRIGEYTNPETAFENISKFLYDMREQLDTILENLDSSNIVAINPDITKVENPNGNVILSEGQLHLKGKENAYFEAGKEKAGTSLTFEVANASGKKLMYINGDSLVFDEEVIFYIDGGKWDK